MNKLCELTANTEELVIDLLESGNSLLLIRNSNAKFILERAPLNNKETTVLDCQDTSISTLHIQSEILEEFINATCYIDFGSWINID